MSPGMSRFALRASGLKSMIGCGRSGERRRDRRRRRASASLERAARSSARPVAAARASATRPSCRSRRSARESRPARRRGAGARSRAGSRCRPARCPATISSPQRVARRGARHDVEQARVDEVLDQRAALLRAALVEHDGRHVLDVGVDEPEEDELERREARSAKTQRAAVAQHLERLLAQHGAKPLIARPRRRRRPRSSRRPIGCAARQAHEDVLERGLDRPHVDRRRAAALEIRGDPRVRRLRPRPAGAARCRRSSPRRRTASARAWPITAAAPPSHAASTRRVPAGVTSRAASAARPASPTPACARGRDRRRVPQRSASSM